MKKFRLFFLVASLLFPVIFTKAQDITVQVLSSGTATSLRGLSVVNDNIVWVSGSHGKVGRSTNAGKNWKWMTVKGFENIEFRDIEAFGANTAIIMAAGEQAYILKTTDAGDTWKVVYENHTKGMFLDAMDFITPQYGMVIGDPVDGHFFMASTEDTGDTWKELRATNGITKADTGEAFFAASGTNIRLFRGNKFYMVSGGAQSRLITPVKTYSLPIVQGRSSAGANSIAVYDNGNLKGSDNMIVVGGDYLADSVSDNNCFYTHNGGRSWKAPRVPPYGYKSCVEYITRRDIIACGPTGVDISQDGGKTWRLVSTEGFHVCRFARFGSSVFLAGSNGKIGKLVLSSGLEQ